MLSFWFLLMLGLLLMGDVMSYLCASGNFIFSVFLMAEKSLFDFLLEFNELSKLFGSAVVLIAACVFFWSRFYMAGGLNLVFFLMSLFMFVMSMLVLIFSKSFMSVFLGWEGLGVTSFVLIVYYQNWSSFKGGVLTLLTNRVGDAILLTSFAYWTLSNSYSALVSKGSFYLGVLFLVLTLTKSAQTPFTSWLPAAMAAPTPVSALVHSSTLVTAGIWLLIRFNQSVQTTLSVSVFTGVMTLLVASMAALVEADAKKVVALSTLSQLGLMYFSMLMGGAYICLFHLLMHAFAKANLFLMIGNLIHSRFSQQDVRTMSTGDSNTVSFFMMMVSVGSLSGLMFTSGFFSKESVLLWNYGLMNSLLFLILSVSVVALTFSYCAKIVSLLFKKANSQSLLQKDSSKASMVPSSFLSIMSLYSGYIYNQNMSLFTLWKSKVVGTYWVFLFLLGVFLVKMSRELKLGSLFKTQSTLIDFSNKALLLVFKKISIKFSNSFLEGGYLISSLTLQKVLWVFSQSLIFFFISAVTFYIL